MKARNIQKYFCGVYGAPSKKSDIILQIIKKEGINIHEVLFVGDSKTDYLEAKKIGVPFVVRIVDEPKCVFPKTVQTVRDLKELDTIVRGLI